MGKTRSLAETLKQSLAHKVEVVWTARPEILLCGNIPEPMHGTNPRTILGSTWWNGTRLAAYRSTDQHCIACSVHRYAAPRSQLEGHELYEVDYLLGRMTYLETVPVCTICHQYIHSGRLCALLEKNEITQEKFDLVVHHGDRVLRKAGLSQKGLAGIDVIANLDTAPPWKDWRLIVNGYDYKPFHKTRKAWIKAHEGK